jgi:hypothetical protein
VYSPVKAWPVMKRISVEWVSLENLAFGWFLFCSFGPGPTFPAPVCVVLKVWWAFPSGGFHRAVWKAIDERGLL